MKEAYDLFLHGEDLFALDFDSMVDIEPFGLILKQMVVIHDFLAPSVEIANNTELPQKLESKLEDEIKMYNRHHMRIVDFNQQAPKSYHVEQFERFKGELIRYVSDFFEISSSYQILQVVNTINSFSKQMLNDQLYQLSQHYSAYSDLIPKVNSLYDELSEKATKTVISDYAKVFEMQETRYKTVSKNWLTAAIGSTISLIVLIGAGIIFKWFETTTTLNSFDGSTTKTNEVFDYPILISKVLIVSFLVFVVSFLFKQYSIYKNLELVNQHRKNAINSYKLFEASLDDKDSASKNLLMTQLAKSIYEMIHTGLLSHGKNDSSNSMFELTKFVSNPTNQL